MKNQQVMEDDAHTAIKRIAALVSTQPLGLAEYRPEPWAEPRLCFQNADRMARLNDGRVQYGWTFHYRVIPHLQNAGYLFLTHHAVWVRPDSYLIDVTLFHPDRLHHPYMPQDGMVLFLVDDAAIPIQTATLFAPLPLRFFAIGTNPKLTKYVNDLNKGEIAKYKSMLSPIK